MFGHAGLERTAIIQVHAIEPVLGTIPNLVIRESEHGFPAGRKMDLVLLQIPVPESVVGRSGSQIVSLLALLQRSLGAAAL